MGHFYLFVCRNLLLTVAVLALFTSAAAAQTYAVPELMYFKFDQTGTTVNNDAASSTRVTTSATINGSMSMGGTGQFGNALQGAGGNSNTNYVNTGWKTDLGTGSWTISFWLSGYSTTSTTGYYLFGDVNASQFRCFIGDAAGPGNILLRGAGISDVLLQGLPSSGSAVITFTFDAKKEEAKAYINGSLKTTVNKQDKVKINSSANTFKIGSYSTAAALGSGMLIDEFRVYNRALSSTEIALTYDKELPYTPPPMYYKSATVNQFSGKTFKGNNFAKILQVKINMSSGYPTDITKLYFSTGGTSSTNDIQNARLYYTENDDYNLLPLDISDTLGSIVAAPNGRIGFTVDEELLPGDNYFYLTYDIKTGATLNNVADATLDSFVVSDTMTYPSNGNPSGSRLINNYGSYCNVAVTNTGSFLIGLTSVKIGATIDNNTADLNTVTFYPTQKLSGYRLEEFDVTIKYGQGNNEQIRAWADWNNDGYFDENAEQVFYTANTAAGGTYKTTLTIPCTATAGNHVLRIASDFSGSSVLTPCKDLQYGDVEEYVIEVFADPVLDVKYSVDTPNYQGSVVKFKNLSNAKGIVTYEWDYNNDGKADGYGRDGSYTFYSNGWKKVKLTATWEGCDSTVIKHFLDSVYIEYPRAKPVSEFISNKNLTNIYDPVIFNDLSTHKPSDWRWEVSPNTFNGKPTHTYQYGTDRFMQNPIIRFDYPGDYTISLTAGNMLGFGNKETKVAYITVAANASFCSAGNNTVDTVRDDLGYLYDDGGQNAIYTNSKNCFIVIKPPCAETISLTFNSFDVSIYQTAGTAQAGDYLRIYDGKDNKGKNLHDSAGYSHGFQNTFATNVPLIPPKVTANSGVMYLEWHSDGAFVGDGFEAQWTSTLRTSAPPKAKFTANDTTWESHTVLFQNQSTGPELRYFWDFTNDGINDNNDANPYYIYKTQGIYTVRLITVNCGGRDTFYKNIIVKRPASTPTANFKAEYTNLNAGDGVQFTDLSTNYPYSWNWNVTPQYSGAKWAFYNGSSSTSQHPYIRFLDTGAYSVSLNVTNSRGTAYTNKTYYIKVKNKCLPTVLNLTPDLGVSNVTITAIGNNEIVNNNSEPGKAAFSHQPTPKPLTLEIGGKFDVKISRPSAHNIMNGRVWVDYNLDGDFSDSGELVISVDSITTAEWGGSFTVPAGITLGISRLRIGVNYNNRIPVACGFNEYGEFEDYTVALVADLLGPVMYGCWLVDELPL